jgi:hypothetical protein
MSGEGDNKINLGGSIGDGTMASASAPSSTGMGASALSDTLAEELRAMRKAQADMFAKLADDVKQLKLRIGEVNTELSTFRTAADPRGTIGGGLLTRKPLPGTSTGMPGKAASTTVEVTHLPSRLEPR